MIYFCADDYGLDEISSMHIQQCIDDGLLDKVSIFPNFNEIDFHRILRNRKIRISLHLNLVEGKCMADADEISLLTDGNGNLKHTFIGLFIDNLLCGKKLEDQVYKEIKAQILFWKSVLPDDIPFCIDSHQHTHMIPAVMNALLRVLSEEKIQVRHLRIPAEPLMPYVKNVSLYLTYGAANLVKQWLLKFLWAVNKKKVKKQNIPTMYFMGILFSGKMDEKRVSKILPEYSKIAEKNGMDIEVLFHPGYSDKNDNGFEGKNVVFSHFYLSENRKIEFDAVKKIRERGMV